MTTSSSGSGSGSGNGRWHRNVPPPGGAATAKAQAYSRFIPREEFDAFSAWSPGALEGGAGAAVGERRATPRGAPDPAAAAKASAAQATAARQGGYQDGYRDGLAALDAFKQSYASQAAAQLGTLTAAYDRQLDALQREMAQALAQAAVQLARQVVRSELALRPALVATVASDALDALLTSARHVSVRVHPDDHALVAQGAGEALAARGARLVADATLLRGGCVIDSDIGAVDATLPARWARAAAGLGATAAWDAAPAPDASPAERSHVELVE